MAFHGKSHFRAMVAPGKAKCKGERKESNLDVRSPMQPLQVVVIWVNALLDLDTATTPVLLLWPFARLTSRFRLKSDEQGGALRMGGDFPVYSEIEKALSQ